MKHQNADCCKYELHLQVAVRDNNRCNEALKILANPLVLGSISLSREFGRSYCFVAIYEIAIPNFVRATKCLHRLFSI